jgi:hypothetical protein
LWESAAGWQRFEERSGNDKRHDGDREKRPGTGDNSTGQCQGTLLTLSGPVDLACLPSS